MALDTMQELLVEELRDIHNAEQQLVKALPKLASAATTRTSSATSWSRRVAARRCTTY